jgi:hypothetical protein
LNMSSPEEFRNISFLNIIKLKIPVHNIWLIIIKQYLEQDTRH